nr:alpha/beta fold hydrolase [Candidatus Sigynarchaeota archaeon]
MVAFVRKEARKILALTAIYLAFFIPTVLVATHGTNLAAAYYQGYTINTHGVRTFDGYYFEFFTVMRDNITTVTDHSIPLVIMFHGLGGGKEEILDHAMDFALNGYFVVVPDVRGHGSHEGGIRLDVEWRDAVQAVDFVFNSSSYPMINTSTYGTWGHSHGAFMSVMTAIHDPRVSACVASCGAYNTTELIRYQDSRLYIIGTSYDVTNPEEIRIRSPIELASPTNPRNLRLFAGDSDDNVPYFHSLQFNATVNPYGNRTDYEFLVYPGEGHGVGYKIETLRKAMTWYDKYLKGIVSNETTIPLFSAPFSKNGIGKAFELVFWLTIAGFVPLVFLIEACVVAAWNAFVSKKWTGKKDNLLVSADYAARIKTASKDPGTVQRSALAGAGKLALIIICTWLIISLISGAAIANMLFSRILAFFGIPFVGLLVYAIIHDARIKSANHPRIFRGLDHAVFTSNDFTKDMVLAAVNVIPAWIIQTQVYNIVAARSFVSVTLIGNFWAAYPWIPVSGGMLGMLALFIVAVFVMAAAFRGTFTAMSRATMPRGEFGNTAAMFPGTKRDRNIRRFFAWFGQMILHALFVAAIVMGGSYFFLLLAPSPRVTDIDFYIQLNPLMTLAFALVAIVCMVIQQVLEKLLRSFSKSVLITALVLLGFFMSIAPRPW